MSSPFLGVTAHFFNTVDHKKYNITLAVRPFESPHTRNRILSEIKSILSEYDIRIQDIGVILIDNGSNMIKAFNADSLLNLVTDDNDGESQDGEDTEEPEGAMTTDEHSFDSDTNIETLPSETQSIADIEEYEFSEGDHNIAFSGYCQRLSCFSHTLQLVMAEFDNNERLNSLKKVIKKAQALVSKCNKSVKVTEKLIELSGKKLVSNCPTRWSSSYLLIERLLCLKPFLADVLAELDWDNLQNSDCKTLENIRDLLEPFAKYTQLASGEDMSTISMVIPIIMELNMHLDEMKNRPGVSTACTVLKDAMHKRFDKVLKPNVVNSQDTFEKVYVATTFLDQRYRDLLDENQLKAATTFLSTLATSSEFQSTRASTEHEETLHTEEQEQTAKYPTISQENEKLTMNGTCNVSTIMLDQNTSDPVLPPARKKAKTFKYITNILASKRKDNNSQPQTVVLPIEDEVAIYLRHPVIEEHNALDFDPLSYWSSNYAKHPLLSSLAESLLTIPASSAPSERVFSAAGIAMMGGRNRLDKHNLEREVLLKKNKFVLNIDSV